MDILDNYLDTMFSVYPITPKTQEAKRELRAMMEDAYNGALAAGHPKNEAIGQAITEFGNIEEVAPLLGLTKREPDNGQPFTPTAEVPAAGNGVIPSVQFEPTVGQDEAGQLGSHETLAGTAALDTYATSTPLPARRFITMAQAQNYLDTMRQTRWMLGAGVAMIVLGTAPFFGLTTAYGDVGGRRETMSLLLAFALILPLIGAGVGLVTYRSQRLSPFRRITSGTDLCSPEVEAYADAVNQQASPKRTAALSLAVALWIISAFPIIGSGIFTQDWPQKEASPIVGLGISITLTLVAIGLLLFLPANWANSALVNLLKTSPNTITTDPSEENQARYPTWVKVILALYWPLTTVIYLAWSFITWYWHITWIIWPIAGLIFGAFNALARALYPPNQTKTS